MTQLSSPETETEPARAERGRSQPLVSFFAALQFLTVLPPLVRRLFTDDELGRSVGWFPLVGLFIGGLLALLNTALMRLFPAPLAAAIVLSAWVLLTGALHLDGFLDSCDGLLGGRTPEDRLRIMRDERVGAFAVSGGVLLLLLKHSALSSLAQPSCAVVVAPVVGRWLISLAVVRYPYAREHGLGRSMKDHAGKREAVISSVLALLAVIIIGDRCGALAVAVAGFAGWCVVRLALARLPGLTGDVYGAVCEISEAVVLIVFTACPYSAA